MDRSADGFRVRVDQQLRRVEAIAVRGIVRAMYAIAVELAGTHVREIAVPNLIGALANADHIRFDRIVFTIEEAEIDRRCIFGEQGEVDALAVPRCSERIGFAGPDAHSGWSLVQDG